MGDRCIEGKNAIFVFVYGYKLIAKPKAIKNRNCKVSQLFSNDTGSSPNALSSLLIYSCLSISTSKHYELIGVVKETSDFSGDLGLLRCVNEHK